jgi:hypothetical protein
VELCGVGFIGGGRAPGGAGWWPWPTGARGLASSGWGRDDVCGMASARRESRCQGEGRGVREPIEAETSRALALSRVR